jgi:hypothetical protein
VKTREAIVIPSSPDLGLASEADVHAAPIGYKYEIDEVGMMINNKCDANGATNEHCWCWIASNIPSTCWQCQQLIR